MHDTEQKRVQNETLVKANPSNIDAVVYLAQWHLQRHSYSQVQSIHAWRS